MHIVVLEYDAVGTLLLFDGPSIALQLFSACVLTCKLLKVRGHVPQQYLTLGTVQLVISETTGENALVMVMKKDFASDLTVPVPKI